MPLAAVATDVGFSDQSHFTTCIARHSRNDPGQHLGLRCGQARRVFQACARPEWSYSDPYIAASGTTLSYMAH